jgi:predicted metalloprotease with PDZ domain
MKAQLTRWVDGTDDLPLARLFAPLGIDMTMTATDPSPSLGVRLAQRGAELQVTSALTGGAAQRAGVSSGDVLVACDGIRVNEAMLKAMLARRTPGDRVRLHAFRRDELLEFEATLDAPIQTEVNLALKPGANPLRDAWLNVRASDRDARREKSGRS